MADEIITDVPLGYIIPSLRTDEQNYADAQAKRMFNKFSIKGARLPRFGQLDVRLYKYLEHHDVIKDVGFLFRRWRQLTGSCLPAGSLVRMADGSEKPIEQVRYGDRVVTHTGKHKRVTDTMRRKYTGEMVSFTASGFPFPVTVTEDHQVAVMPGKGYGRWEPTEIEWVEAGELKEGDRVLIGWSRESEGKGRIDAAVVLGDDCIVMDELMKENAFIEGNEPNVPNANFSSARSVARKSGVDWRGKVRLHRSRVSNSINRYIPICPSLGRFIGLYLAEGGTHEGRVTFTFNAKERETLAAEVIALGKGLFGADGYIAETNRDTVCCVRFDNINLAEFMKSLMQGDVYTKRVPACMMSADEPTRMALVSGWMSGDGHKAMKRDQVVIVGVTVSELLARDMVTISLSLGMRATSRKRKAMGRSREAYEVYYSGKKAVCNLYPQAVAAREERQRFSDNDVAWTQYGYARRIKSIDTKPVTQLDVYDFEVEGDHSFVAGGIVVHNCVGAGWGQVMAVLLAVQRLFADNPTKAALIFWMFNYGRSRFLNGWRTPGEGSLGSLLAKSVLMDGVVPIDDSTRAKLPAFQDTGDEGLIYTESLEMAYSDGDGAGNMALMSIAKEYPVKAVAEITNTNDMALSLANGYPLTLGSDGHCRRVSLKGSGPNQMLVGTNNTSGGHQWACIAVVDNPELGRMFGMLNNWDTGVYPADPFSQIPCFYWCTEAETARTLRAGGECYSFSNFPYHKAQPDVAVSWLF